MTNLFHISGGPSPSRKVPVFLYARRHPIRIKGAAGGVLWTLAATLVLVDSDDDRLGILSALAFIPLGTGLTLIALAVIDWQANRMRKVMWTIADLIRNEKQRRLRVVGRR